MPDPFDYNQIQDYLTSLVPPRAGELKEMEAYAEAHGFPIIGPAAGYACYQIARMIGARNIFELGSGYGYSTAWFARAVKENGGGKVHHTVWDKDLSMLARKHLNRLGYTDLVQYRIGEAVEALRTTPGTFDLIFNDIDKEAYPASLPLIKQKLRSGGVLIIDNMLWHARIFDPNDQDTSTEAIRQFTRLITADPDWIVTLLPIRDGLIVAYKR
ncbi:MAG: O-methyltransferase [Anaerolineales bacterium]